MAMHCFENHESHPSKTYRFNTIQQAVSKKISRLPDEMVAPKQDPSKIPNANKYPERWLFENGDFDVLCSSSS